MTGRKGNSEFCFPETLNVPRGEADRWGGGGGGGGGRQNSLFPEGPVIKCFVIPPDSKIEKAPKNYLLEAFAYTGCARKIERLPKPPVLSKSHDNSLFLRS